ncbi:MAG: hypothetical protein QGG17_10030 [Rhodospirillales bacterium]|jgi:hypothetical protein|nr:hypothetical protein [Rhodospirillales bacterium]
MIPTVVGMREELRPAVADDIEPRPAGALVLTEEVERRPWGEPATERPPMRQAGLPGEMALSARLRARLRTPHSLREAFVVKEILDRPVGMRRGRNR